MAAETIHANRTAPSVAFRAGSEPSFDVVYSESRSRLTVAFRYILAIPHIVIAAAWGYFAQLIGFVQWFIVLFTGRRNEGIWNLQHSWLGCSARVSGYESLLFDEWPAIGPDPEAEPTVFRMECPRPSGDPAAPVARLPTTSVRPGGPLPQNSVESRASAARDSRPKPT